MSGVDKYPTDPAPAGDPTAPQVRELPTEGRLMAKAEIVERLGISKRYFEEIQAAGQVPVIKIGALARYEWRAVCEALRRNFGVNYPEPAEAAGAR